MAKALSITVLVENTVNQAGLLAEHGLAFWIQHAGGHTLFDAGQGMALVHNADKLGIDLSTADRVALSHGHYDHSGGLAATLSSFSQATVYAHSTAFSDRFSQHSETDVRSVRSPIPSFDWLESRVSQAIRTDDQPIDLGDGIWLTGAIPRRNDFEDTGGAFYLDQACTQPDPIVDDQAVYVRAKNGLVVLLGCAHAGMVNTLDYICAMTGENRIQAVLGGMHLLDANEHRMEQTIRRLRELDVQQVGLAHCTGFPAMVRLQQEWPTRCFRCDVGTRIDFD